MPRPVSRSTSAMLSVVDGEAMPISSSICHGQTLQIMVISSMIAELNQFCNRQIGLEMMLLNVFRWDRVAPTVSVAALYTCKRPTAELRSRRVVLSAWVGLWRFGARPGSGVAMPGADFLRPRSLPVRLAAIRERFSSSLPPSFAPGRCAAFFFPLRGECL